MEQTGRAWRAAATPAPGRQTETTGRTAHGGNTPIYVKKREEEAIGDNDALADTAAPLWNELELSDFEGKLTDPLGGGGYGDGMFVLYLPLHVDSLFVCFLCGFLLFVFHHITLKRFCSFRFSVQSQLERKLGGSEKGEVWT